MECGSSIEHGRKEPRSTRWSRTKRMKAQICQSENVDGVRTEVDSNMEKNDDCALCTEEVSYLKEPAVPDLPDDNMLNLRGGNDSSSSFSSSDGDEKPKLKVKRRKQRKRTAIPEDACDSSGTPGSILSSPALSSDECGTESTLETTVPETTLQQNEHLSNNVIPTTPSEQIETLCPCTDMGVNDIVFSILSLGMRHKLSWDAQVDILKLFSVVFKSDKIPTNKYAYLKRFKVDKAQVTSHIFCSFCHRYAGEKQQVKNSPSCTNCKETIDVNSVTNSFITMSVASQLQTFLKDKSFVHNILNYRYQKPQDSSQTFRDIYDGAVYKKLSTDGNIFSNPMNFSYTFFTDGLAFGNTSDKTVWPVYLTVNEIPYEERSKYLILAALYIGAKDPNLQTYLQPFVTEANKLSDVGVEWIYNGETVISKVIPLCCVADSVARCKIMNYQALGAKYGCTFCYHNEA